MIMKPWAVRLVFVVVVVIGAACGSSPDTSQDSAPQSEPEQPDPTATPVPSPTPQPDPTATPIPTPTPKPDPTATPIPTPQSESQEASPTATPEASPPLDPQEVETIRMLSSAYWEAINAYDADKALGYMEESYRQEQEETLRGNINLMTTFALKLTVSEESAPQAVDDETRETYWTVKGPLTVDRIHMIFRQIEGEWKIVSAEQVQ